MLRINCLLPALLLSAAGGAFAAAPRYAVTVLDAVPGGAVYAINNAGVAVGTRYDADIGAWRAFSWSAGQLAMLPPSMEAAHAISNAGHIAGIGRTYETESVQVRDAWLYHRGAMTQLPRAFEPDDSGTHWYTLSAPVSITSNGTVLVNQFTNGVQGTYTSLNGVNTVLPMWRGDAINEAGQIIGSPGYDSGTTSRALLYSNGQLVDLGGLPTQLPRESQVHDINDAGVVVGSSRYGNRGQARTHSFIWQDGVMQPLGTLTKVNAAVGINNSGDIIGAFETDGAGLDRLHSYLYRDGVQYDLATLLAGGGGWQMVGVSDINDSGQIVGTACDAGGACYAALLTPVPEPAVYGMLLAGLAVLAGGARRGRLSAN